MIRPKRLVDGGYLTWTYGASPFGLAQWGKAAYKKYDRKSDSLMLMDSSHNLRKDYAEDYKGHRAERYDKDDERIAAKERVDMLREMIEEDPRIHSLQIDGLEADDLIACFIHLRLLNRPVSLIGVDKDLLQLPTGSIKMSDHKGQVVGLKKFARSLPKILHDEILRPEHVLLTLALYGDKSDNVPRVVSKVNEVIPIIRNEKPFSQAKLIYGNRFISNLWLTVLPFPGIISTEPSIGKLPDILDRLGPGWIGGDFKINRELIEQIDAYLLQGEF